MKEEFETMLRYISELGVFLTKLRHRIAETELCEISETVERYLDGFFTQRRRCANNVVSKPNKKVKNLQAWSEEEKKDMPFLKDLKYRITQDGIHQFRYRRDGFNVSFNSKNFEVAKKKAHAFIKHLKKTIHSEADIIKGKTLDYIAQAWFELKASLLDAHTLRCYKSVYKNHIAPKFGKRSVKTILPLDLQPFFNNLFPTLGKTCENAKIILNGIFQYAVANRLCPTNPMAGVYVQKHYRKTGNALTEEQLKRFKIKMAGEGALGLAGLIILNSGIRGCELESMTFNWMQGTFTVKNGKLKAGQKANPKNLYRTVPIFPGLLKLKDRIEKETWRIPAKKLSNDFSSIWQENSVKDLRHTFTSIARESAVENELVNLWTGHLPGNNVTANVYTHFSLKFQIAESKKVSI